MTKQEIINYFLSRGRKQDKYGNFTLTAQNGKTYRYKLGKNSLRFEVKSTIEATMYSAKSSSWIRLRSAYYKDIFMAENGKISGLRY